MSSSPASSSSHLFTLRIWREDMGHGEFEWRACIQHVLSGEARYVRAWNEIELFVASLEEANPACPGDEKPSIS